MEREYALTDLLRRPGVHYAELMTFPGAGVPVADPAVAEQVEVATKYEGYIDRQHAEIARHLAHEETPTAAGSRVPRGTRLVHRGAAEARAQRPETRGTGFAHVRHDAGRHLAAARPSAQAHRRGGAATQAARVKATPMVTIAVERRGCGRTSTRCSSGPGTPRARCRTAARERLLRYVALLAKWNSVYNLTAIREPQRMVTHHLLDGLAVLPVLDALVAEREALTVLDVGSGAGLPGLPIAIARPHWQVTMREPVQKKVAFVTQAIAELAAANAHASLGRVEDLRSGAGFAIVISRAFADLATFVQTSLAQVADDGALVAMKGVYPDEELRELPARRERGARGRVACPRGERHFVMRTVTA